MFLATIFVLIFVASIVGNFGVLIFFNRERWLIQQRLSRFLVHLAVGDLLVCLLTMPPEFVSAFMHVSWPFGDIGCRLVMYLQHFTLAASTFLLVAMTYDRYRVFTVTLGTSSSYRPGLGLTAAWVMAALVAIPQVLIWTAVIIPSDGSTNSSEYDHIKVNSTLERWLTNNSTPVLNATEAAESSQLLALTNGTALPFIICKSEGYTAYWQRTAYFTFLAFYIWLFPFFMLIFWYWRIFVNIRSSSGLKKDAKRLLRAPDSTDQQAPVALMNQLSKARTNTLYLSSVVVIAFFVCWSAYFVPYLVYIHTNKSVKLPLIVVQLSRIMPTFHNLLNPIIYGIFHIWGHHRRRNGSSSYRTSVLRSQKGDANKSLAAKKRELIRAKTLDATFFRGRPNSHLKTMKTTGTLEVANLTSSPDLPPPDLPPQNSTPIRDHQLRPRPVQEDTAILPCPKSSEEQGDRSRNSFNNGVLTVFQPNNRKSF